MEAYILRQIVQPVVGWRWLNCKKRKKIWIWNLKNQADTQQNKWTLTVMTWSPVMRYLNQAYITFLHFVTFTQLTQTLDSCAGHKNNKSIWPGVHLSPSDPVSKYPWNVVSMNIFWHSGMQVDWKKRLIRQSGLVCQTIESQTLISHLHMGPPQTGNMTKSIFK